MLTEEQSRIKSEVIQALESNNFVKLLGSAGVGKTYLVASIIEELLNIKRAGIVCAAPTHKAVAVLKEKISSKNRVTFSTIHQALKLKRKIDNKTGQISFVPDTNPKNNIILQGCTHLFIDESSMLSEDILDMIEKAAKTKRFKIVYIGDYKQINPVGEEDISKVFSRDYPTMELTTIIRQGEGNPIIDLSRDLPSIYNKASNVNSSGSGYIYTDDFDRIITTLAHANGTNLLKYLAYTNREVSRVNTLVRKKIYGENPGKIELNEKLVFNAPYKDNKFVNNEEILVERLRIIDKEFKVMTHIDPITEKEVYEKINLKVYDINYTEVKTPEFSNKTSWIFNTLTDDVVEGILVIHEDSEADYKNIVSNLKTASIGGLVPWKFTIEFQEQFADLTYCHALTVHKSQGSTFNQVILNVTDIKRFCPPHELDKLLYTGVTRASNLLIFYKV